MSNPTVIPCCKATTRFFLRSYWIARLTQEFWQMPGGMEAN